MMCGNMYLHLVNMHYDTPGNTHVTHISSQPSTTGGHKDNNKENVPLVINYAEL